MKQKAVKIGITVVVLAGALAALLMSTLSDGTEYYKHVEEVMANPAQWQGKSLQVHGYVVKDSILRKRDSLDYKFKVQSKGFVIDASYTGVVPDTFKEGAEVVLTGRLSPHGFDVAPGGVTAKCPSKYVAGQASQ